MHKRAANWKNLPGNWDPLHLNKKIFPSDNAYGIPTIPNNANIPSHLLQWGSRPQLAATSPVSNTAVHFFLDDYRFESLWHNPLRNFDVLQRIGLVLSPDFSLFRDMPVAMQIWNVYRNRWLGCFWQQYGLRVIPTVSWSNPHDFCYAGIEPRSIVAISSVGVVRDRLACRLFRAGFEQMIEVLKPSTILSYGSLDSLVTTSTPIVTFPTRWENGRRERAPKYVMQPLSLWEETYT
jgi:Domain of unknown function (DUF4417)